MSTLLSPTIALERLASFDALSQQASNENFVAYAAPPPEQASVLARADGGEEQQHAYVLRWGKTSIGYCTLAKEGNFGRLDAWYLQPAYVEQYGIQAVLAAIKQVAFACQYSYLTVWSNLEHQGLYDQAGGQVASKGEGTTLVEYYLTVVDAPWVNLATAGLVCVKGDQLLLAFSKNKQAWYLPGGKIDAGESSVEALTREIEEELSLVLDPHRLSFLTSIVAPAYGEKKNILMQQACYFYDLGEDTITVAQEIGGVAYFTKEAYVARQIPVPGVLKIFDFLAVNKR